MHRSARVGTKPYEREVLVNNVSPPSWRVMKTTGRLLHPSCNPRRVLLLSPSGYGVVQCGGSDCKGRDFFSQ